jgi:hypothetical protein
VDVTTEPFKTGDLITNSSGAIASVGERVEYDPRWKAAGFRIMPLRTGFGDGYGYSHFTPDYLLQGWRIAPQEWSPVLGCPGVEERWTYKAAGDIWTRELRNITEQAETPTGGDDRG